MCACCVYSHTFDPSIVNILSMFDDLTSSELRRKETNTKEDEKKNKVTKGQKQK